MYSPARRTALIWRKGNTEEPRRAEENRGGTIGKVGSHTIVKGEQLSVLEQ